MMNAPYFRPADAGGQVAVGLAVLHPRLGADGVIRRHHVGVVLHGVGLPAVVVERTQEPVVLADLILRQRVGRHALGAAELAVGVVRAQPRPVVVGAEIDILPAVRHHHIVEGYRFHILPHSGQNILLRLSLIAARNIAVQRVRQRDAAGQRHRQRVHRAGAGQLLGHGGHDLAVVLGQAVHIVVHLKAGIPHDIHAAGLVGRGVGGDGIQRLAAGLTAAVIRLLGIAAGLAVLPVGAAGGLLGIVWLLRIVGLDHCGAVRPVGGFVLLEHIRKDSQRPQHQRRRHDQQQDRRHGTSAAAIVPSAVSPAAHFTYSLMTLRAVSVSELTHSTTQVP